MVYSTTGSRFNLCRRRKAKRVEAREVDLVREMFCVRLVVANSPLPVIFIDEVLVHSGGVSVQSLCVVRD